MAGNGFEIEDRDQRVASWGPSGPKAHALAQRIAGELQRRTGRGVPPHPGRNGPGARRGGPAVPESRMGGADVDALGRLTATRTDDVARRALSLGKSYPDLLAARGERLERAADAVVQPRTQEEVDRALAWLAEHDIAAVPVGGGTSVVGGIEPLGARPDQPVVAIDMSQLDAVLDVDHVGRVAHLQAGISGPALERELATHGLTLGHSPQSFHLSTLGGWIATRSAGQQSLAFGKIEQMTAGLRMSTPAGIVQVNHLPAHGAGPGGLDLVLGSEGTLGVITSATMRVSPRPEVVRFASFLAPTFEAAATAARTLVQRGLRPAMVRVSDAVETAYSIGSSAPKVVPRSAAALLARKLGYGEASLVMVVMPGDPREAAALEQLVGRHMRGAGLRPVGPLPAKHWYHSRFLQPCARDLLMDRGLLVDSLETAVPWGTLHAMHTEMRRALETALGADRCLLGCHLSHLYRDGASAYFTFVAQPEPGRELATWRAAKRAAHEVLQRHGAATSHQHGVGTMHAELYEAVTSPLLVEGWRATKRTLDPGGILNPGKCYVAPEHGTATTVRPLNGVGARS